MAAKERGYNAASFLLGSGLDGGIRAHGTRLRVRSASGIAMYGHCH
jgi:hypothetical protein